MEVPHDRAADVGSCRFEGVSILGVDDRTVSHEALLFRVEVVVGGLPRDPTFSGEEPAKPCQGRSTTLPSSKQRPLTLPATR